MVANGKVNGKALCMRHVSTADGSGWRHRAINVDEVHEGPLEARRLPHGAGEDARNRFGGSVSHGAETATWHCDSGRRGLW